MEMVLSNNFSIISNDDLQLLDGGTWLQIAVGLGGIVLAVGTLCGLTEIGFLACLAYYVAIGASFDYIYWGVQSL